MVTRRTPGKPPAEPARWRIVRGDKLLASFASEAMARKRFTEMSRTVAGHGAKLLQPDGTEAE